MSKPACLKESASANLTYVSSGAVTKETKFARTCGSKRMPFYIPHILNYGNFDIKVKVKICFKI
jgi:hypothetical protein